MNVQLIYIFIYLWAQNVWGVTSTEFTQLAKKEVGESGALEARSPFPGSRYSKLSGMESIKENDKEFYNKKYNREAYVFGKSPVKFLAENYTYLSPQSKILDMGMAEGRNAVFLAQKGHKVTGVDISSVAIKKALLLAKEMHVQINSALASLREYRIKDGEFDAIICFYFVDRTLFEKMINWLKPGGVLFFEAYTTNQKTMPGFNIADFNPNYYLRPQELLSLFPDMTILKYEEPLHESEFRASIILKKMVTPSR